MKPKSLSASVVPVVLTVALAGQCLVSTARAAPIPVRAPLSTPLVVPTLTAGPPVSVSNSGPRTGPTAPVSAALNAQVVQLHGITGIQQAANIPQGARDFLLLHAQALPAGEVPNYVVNLDLARTWFQAHPEPDSVHTAASQSGSSAPKCDLSNISVKCAEAAGQHAIDEVRRQAQAEWNHLTGEVAHDWNMATDCFSDTTLKLRDVPVNFSAVPGFSLPIGTERPTGTARGAASPSLARGTLSVGLPIDAAFSASVDVSYIPCLPFAIRPSQIGADGTLDIGERLTAAMTTSGQFSQTFAIPPGGGSDFPIEVIPVRLDGTTITMLDITVYLDGQVTVEGNATMSGELKEEIRQHTAFGFGCGGAGCDLSVRSALTPLTTTESVKLDGRLRIKPAIYAALGIGFAGDLLSARAGAEPYLQGEVAGCSAASATQSTDGAANAGSNYGLTADYDWGIELLAEARVGPEKTGSRSWKDAQHHIAFDDLAHSTYLQPVLNGTAQAEAQAPSAFQVRMPSCYPYPDAIEYHLEWTGSANASNGAPSTMTRPAGISAPAAASSSLAAGQSSVCSLGTGTASCSTDPRRAVLVNLAWPAAGDYVVSAGAVHDAHGREFKDVRASQQTVHVQSSQQQSAASPAQSASSPPPAPAAAPVHLARAAPAWRLQPNVKLTGQLGALVIALPAGAGNTPVRVRTAGQQSTAFTGLGSQNRRLAVGSYDVMIGNATVPGIEIRSGSDTLVLAGALRVNADNRTTYEILDADNQQIAKRYGKSIIALPVGTYLLRIGGQTQTITIADGQILDY